MQVSVPPNGGEARSEPRRRGDQVTTDPWGAAGVAEIRGALARLRRTAGLPVAFGGLVEAGRHQVRISELSGTATPALRSLAVASGTGLGGRAAALARPCAVTDYSASRRISHECGAPVAAEGLRSVVAVPVVVRRRVRGVLYGALRSAHPLRDRTLGLAVDAARDAEQGLLGREEAGERLAAVRPGPGGGGPGPGAARAQAREAYAALRGLAAKGAASRERAGGGYAAVRALARRPADPGVRAELLDAAALLAPGPAAPAGVGLAPREVDVLGCLAAGATNAMAARQLGVTAETVKAYLRSAMRKLGARTRGEAVVAARRAGWLPEVCGDFPPGGYF